MTFLQLPVRSSSHVLIVILTIEQYRQKSNLSLVRWNASMIKDRQVTNVAAHIGK